MGLFESPEKKIKEYILDLDPELTIQNIVFHPVGHGYLATGFELIEVHGFDALATAEDALVSKSIIRILLEDSSLKSSTSYLPLNELTKIEHARRWKGGFLLEHSGIVSEFGKNNTQYLSTDLSESILWDCRAPLSPPLGVYYFDVDFFLGIGQDFLIGFDYSLCDMWSKEVKDLFPDSSCSSCSSSIKLLNQIDDTITVEARFNESVRKVVIEFRTGKVLLNEVMK